MSESPDPIETTLSRRRLLRAGAGVAVAAALAACSREEDPQAAGGAPSSSTTGAPATGSPSASATTLTPTPECADDDDDLTVAQTEGPYFKRSSPQKANLFADVSSGTRLVIDGTVLTTTCQPVDRALIDVWQADTAGNYDNATYRLRGHLFTDAQGRYRLETVVPGLYPGRTRHIHVKVQAPDGPVLTTQLYFPGEAQNARDGIYNRALEMDVRDGANGKEATFDFVVNT
ncbi:MAG: dioxygenase [Acidimicrobiia bacterium]